MAEKIDLLDEEFGVDGLEPVELGIGEHSLHIRRSHTGMQVAQWQRLEADTFTARSEVLDKKSTAKKGTKEDDEDTAKKAEKLNEISTSYLRKLLQLITVDPTTDKDIDGVIEFVLTLSSQAMQKIVRAIGVHSGLFTEKGEHVPFLDSPKVGDNTDD